MCQNNGHDLHSYFHDISINSVVCVCIKLDECRMFNNDINDLSLDTDQKMSEPLDKNCSVLALIVTHVHLVASYNIKIIILYHVR